MSPRGKSGIWVVLFPLVLAAGCKAAGGQRAEPASAGAAVTGTAETGGRTLVYVGMAGGELTTFQLDVATGALARRGTVGVGRAPASLVRSVERETLVSVDEATGLAVALSINAKTGALTTVGRTPTGGAQPAGATVDATGKYLLTAHPGSGTVSVLAIKPDGTLGAIDTFRAGPGASAVALHPANQVAFVANARASTVSQYTFNTGTGMLTPKPGPPLTLPKGSGPTRFACHPNGRWVYLLDEASDSVSVHVFDEDVKALSSMSQQIVPTLPDGAPRAKSRPADLALGGGGKYLYVTNRGHDSVAMFAIEPGGTLKLLGHEPAGGHLAGAAAVDPSGAILVIANEGSKNLSVFHIDEGTGKLGGRRTVPLPSPPIAVLAARL
jgi:6-phosphogluconolactonase